MAVTEGMTSYEDCLCEGNDASEGRREAVAPPDMTAAIPWTRVVCEGCSFLLQICVRVSLLPSAKVHSMPKLHVLAAERLWSSNCRAPSSPQFWLDQGSIHRHGP
jgi:hypothetical protein